MFSSIRSIAKVFGLLLAAPLYKISGHGAKLNMVKSVPVMIVLMLIQWQLILYTPKTYKIMIFYAYTFVVYAIFQFLFLTIIPKFCAQKAEKPKEN
jgi:predicted P-loop ATPase/GTPase